MAHGDQTTFAMSSEIVHEFVKDLANRLTTGKLDLPSFPDVAIRIRAVLEDPSASIEKVVAAVETEPVLSARLLRMANSAAFNLSREQVNNLHSAVPKVGFGVIRNAAIAVAVEQLFSASAQGALKPWLHQLWEHSVRVAAIAYVIAQHQKRINPDEALLAGLFHDIGKFYVLVRAEQFPELFADDTEIRRLMEQWHTSIGKAILDAWGIPAEIGLAADEHEVLDREHLGRADLVDVVLAANLHAYMGRANNPYADVDVLELPAFHLLGLDADASRQMMRESSAKIHSLCQALGGTQKKG